MRHAEAEQEQHDQSDFDRVLTPDGQKLAIKTGALLQHHNIPIQRVLTSAAVRTHLTATLVARRACPHAPIQLRQDLYAASQQRIAQVLIEHAPPDENSVLIVAHNPGIAALMLLWSDRFFDVSPGTLLALHAQTDDWHQFHAAPRTAALLIRNGSLETLD